MAEFLDSGRAEPRARPLRHPPRKAKRPRSSWAHWSARTSAASRCGSSTTSTTRGRCPSRRRRRRRRTCSRRCRSATLGIPGIPDLMHHKYVIRDREVVWTGSMNWTQDSWSRQENVIAIIDSPKLALAYGLNFDELWDDGRRARLRHRRAAARRRGRDRAAAVVHARARRSAGAPDREAARPGEAADPDRLSRAQLRPDPRHARRGRARTARSTSPGSSTTPRSTVSSTSGT